MSKRNFNILLYIFLISGSLFFIFVGLTHGKNFLIPIVTAIILAMVMAPVAAKFQSWGVNKGWSVFFADLIVVAFIAFMIFLLAAQANQVANNWSQIENRLKPKIEQAQSYFHNTLNMGSPSGDQQQQNSSAQKPDQQENQQPDQNTQGEQQQINEQQNNVQQGNQDQQQNSRQNQPDSLQQNQDLTEQQNQQSQQETSQQQPIPGLSQPQQQKNEESSSESFNTQSIKSTLTGIIKNIFSFFSNLLLVLVYIFFFLYYSKKFRDTILGMVPDEKREKTKNILNKISKTAQHYLFGRFILIVLLAILYAIGWSLIGLKYALFIALIAALFSLIPYVGNIVGLFLAIAISFLSGSGGTGQIIAIFAIFSVVQFVESYLLEPYVVGHEVDVNPVVVIVGVVLGGIVWGVMGMILSIPILAIIKVIFDNVESLRPLGYALDERDVSSGGGKQEKVKKWFKNKMKQSGMKKSLKKIV